MSWLYIFISVVLVSLASFAGALTLAFKVNNLQKILIYFVAFSAGALIGDSFLHLLPEATEGAGFSVNISVALFLGIATFFVLEKVLRWRHCHELNCHDHPKHLGTMNLIGDGVHNLIDGTLIAASYLVSIPLGVTTTLAVIFHEIPQELGDFGVLLHSGFSKKRALYLNFASACAAILGALIVTCLGYASTELINWLIPFTAGGFIYISLSDLIPELHKEQGLKSSFFQFIFATLGVLVMVGLLRLE